MKRLEKTPQFDIFNDVSLCTLNVIMTCAFSCDDDVQLVGYVIHYDVIVFNHNKQLNTQNSDLLSSRLNVFFSDSHPYVQAVVELAKIQQARTL